MRLTFSLVLGLTLMLTSILSHAQSTDTLRILSYNLLNYRNNSISGCSNVNNNASTKEGHLTTVINYALPDILVCNEIGTSDPAASFRIASNALNQNGRSHYSFTTMQTGNRQNINSSATGNMIFWDNRKLELQASTFIEYDPFNRALVRVIDLYTLYYKDPNLAAHNDTTFLHLFVAHLKAGTSTNDQDQRDWATDAVMAYLDSNNLDGNYLIAGDFNVYRASEAAYQNLINYPVQNLRFFDPISVSGNWTNNSPFAIVHTQSTRTAGGCGAGGGMDDRFDFILASDEVINGTDSIQYLNGSYQALGQDGRRFNGSLTGSPANTSGVPNNVLQAMQNLSDHLPIQMDLILKLPMITSIKERSKAKPFTYTNPVGEQVIVETENWVEATEVQILNMAGQIIMRAPLTHKRSEINCSALQSGVYLIRLVQNGSNGKAQKLIKI